jgi:hypothetical protein
VVAHSVRGELERCFGSIRRHAGVPVTTILVDNASDDDTRSWVRDAHPEVRLIELEQNLGVAARDYGLRESATPYTLFLDSDAARCPRSSTRSKPTRAGASSGRGSSTRTERSSCPPAGSRRSSFRCSGGRRSTASSSAAVP